MRATEIARNMRLFHVTESFEGQVEVLDPWVDEGVGVIELDPEADNDDLFARVRSVEWGWERVVAHTSLHLMKSATFREWTSEVGSG